jgi:queuosine precursor transporter
MALVALFVAAIAAANVLTAELAPVLVTIDGTTAAVTAGTFAIGATFFLRDLVQYRHGLRVAWAAITAALLVNVALSALFDDLLAITLASAGAFLVSETIDTAIYTHAGGRLGPRILVSGLVSCPLDSAVFVVFGLSPLTTGIVPWSSVVATVLVLTAVKVAMQLLAALPLWRVQVARLGEQAA